MIKVFVVDDHPVIRAGLKQVFSVSDDIEIVDEASSGQEALAKVTKGKFDVMLLDINMPGENGIEVLKRIKVEKPELPVIILSIYPEEQYALRALRAGAAGYLTKETDAPIIMKAIRKVNRGRKYISPSLAEKLAFYVSGNEPEKLPHEKLSDREFEVMYMITEGKKVKEIAELLCISESTVATYKTRIMNKLNVKNDVELTIYAMRNELIE